MKPNGQHGLVWITYSLVMAVVMLSLIGMGWAGEMNWSREFFGSIVLPALTVAGVIFVIVMLWDALKN